ncbi:MAG: N-acetyl-gamma-glutamyl-phosphate reductase [Deltaproteobacteria bacterium HGW-Deltaproteobacteria-14]|nr:MAG: N-acetyl-gamma-glutamyl-phosphate reductase [Deltaproteobacteria bacterium HGW-Deltaproteobacteria-14]
MTKQSETKRFDAVVIGGTGYGGAELIRLLLGHPEVRLARVTSIDRVGEPLEAVHLNLPKTGLTFEEMSAPDAARGMDVVFLALPHKVSAAIGASLETADAKVIDLSGDFRLRDPQAYARYYGQTHPHPDLLDGRWVYGLPELNRPAIREARRVASPGCFATSIALGLIPIARAGLLRGRVQTVAATGSSGSGAYPSDGTHHPVRASNMKPYKVLSHQHRPEIEQTLRAAAALGGHDAPLSLEFVPYSAPIPRGILATSFVTVPEATTTAQIAALFAEAYDDAPFIRVLPQGGRQAEVVAVKGSMYVDLSWTLGGAFDGAKQLVVSTAADNLVKGGAGQAVQSMNLMLGLREGSGIDAPALWP